jgi:hypothetical protein
MATKKHKRHRKIGLRAQWEEGFGASGAGLKKGRNFFIYQGIVVLSAQ